MVKRETVFVYMAMGLSLAAAALTGTVPAIIGDPRRRLLDLHRRGRAFRLHVYGVAALTGIGFTMSLFIGTLAFDGTEYQTAVRLDGLSGSLLSGIVGYATLRWLTPVPQAAPPQLARP